MAGVCRYSACSDDGCSRSETLREKRRRLPPEVKRLLRQRRPMAILLPAPTLQPANLINPVDTVGSDAANRGISHDQARREVRDEIQRWLEMRGLDASEFAALLRPSRG